jgi:hypothetical protein
LLPSCPCMPAASTSVLSPLRARAQLQLSPRWGPSHALSFVVRHVDAAVRSQTSRLVAMVSGNRLYEELGVSVPVAPYVRGPRQLFTATPPTLLLLLRIPAAASSSTWSCPTCALAVPPGRAADLPEVEAGISHVAAPRIVAALCLHMRLRDRTSLAIPSHLGVAALLSSVAIAIPIASLPAPCLTLLDALIIETMGYLDIYAIAPAPHMCRTSLATSETRAYLDSDGAAPVPLDVSRILQAAPRIIVNIGLFTIGAVVPVLVTVDPADVGPADAASLVTLPVACFHQLDAFDYIEIVDYFDLDEAAPPPPDVSRILQAAPCNSATTGYYITGAVVPVLLAVDPADAVPHRTLPAVAALQPRAPHEFHETKGQSSLYAACPPTDALSAAY